jgi:hypothetical protein
VCSSLGDAILKKGLILFLSDKRIQTKEGITQDKGQLEDNITLPKLHAGYVLKNSSGWGRSEKGLVVGWRKYDPCG